METIQKKKLAAWTLKTVIMLIVTGFIYSAGTYAQSDKTDVNSPNLLFNVPAGWNYSTAVNGTVTYTNPDKNLYMSVYPYRGMTSSEAMTPATSRRDLLKAFMDDNNWTIDNTTYTPFYMNGMEGVYTTGHTTIDGKDYTGYVYYGNDKNFPDRSYYYYLYTPTSNWDSGQTALQKLYGDLRYDPNKMLMK